MNKLLMDRIRADWSLLNVKDGFPLIAIDVYFLRMELFVNPAYYFKAEIR